MGKFDAFAEAFRKKKEEESKKAPDIVLQKSMVRAVDLLNIMAEDKKPAKVSVRLNIAYPNNQNIVFAILSYCCFVLSLYHLH